MPRVPCDHRQTADNRRRRNQQVRAVMTQPSPKTAPFARLSRAERLDAVREKGLDLGQPNP